MPTSLSSWSRVLGTVAGVLVPVAVAALAGMAVDSTPAWGIVLAAAVVGALAGVAGRRAAYAGAPSHGELTGPPAPGDRRPMADELEGALARGELTLQYQPVYSLDGDTFVGVEALMRWDHPRLGAVAPADFIPVAEASGLIVSLGAWAIDEACRQLRSWQDTLDGTASDALRISVNLSARQLSDPDLPAVVARALTTHGIAPHRLMLEITESVMVADRPERIQRLHDLKGLGVLLAIDDFGTGYSALASLQLLPVDQIKIDKAFVDRISSPAGEALADGILSLARALTLEATAEGIENCHQLAALERLGCRLGQGFHFARPESGHAIGRRLVTAAGPTAA